MITETLTGNRRFRVFTRPFHAAILVLQVEVHKFGEYGFDHPGVDITYWRDATVEDISTTELKN